MKHSIQKWNPNPSYQEDPSSPWLDFHLTEEAMNHLWDSINNPTLPLTNTNSTLAGNISKSYVMYDKDNWFYENALKRCVEIMYFKDWSNYYNVHIAKTFPAPEYSLDKFWVNYQKQYEFNPPHNHIGSYSFVVFMKIPTHWKEQHALPISANSNIPCASNFQFLLGLGEGEFGVRGMVKTKHIQLSPEDEGRILFFPSWLSHQVFPFYGTEEERITLSGNINPHMNSKIKMEIVETNIKVMQSQLAQLKNEKKMREKYDRKKEE